MATGPDHDTSGDAHTIAAPLDSTPALSAAVAPPLVAGRYEILGMLGAGGMGTVYRARDRELDEIVALKLLRRELASSESMLERFRREVKLARRVTHRNVARTFDIGLDSHNAGERFLTMELIEGEMLGARLARRGRLSLHDVVAIGVDVCAGLAAAHAAGVLHRDLKPENVIMAKDGRAVITDFGIARAVVGEGSTHTVGGVIGTPAYMAPEQVEGAEDIDARADLYALGAMLFELLSGQEAWRGGTAISVAAARLLRPPPDVRLFVPELPEPAALLLLRLMARAREERPASAEEAGLLIAALASDLPDRSLTQRTMTAPMPVVAPRTQRTIVAVLPLLNLGPDDDEYLAQTLTEDLVDLLSVVPTLRVRPRGDTLRYTDRSRDLREAGRALAVDVVVDGSLRRIGDIVRFSVRLATVEDGFQLWAKRFDGPPALVLEVADKAASAIAEALTAVRAPSPRAPAADPEAQELYLRGRYLLHRAWFEVSRQGVDLLREAHRRAPEDTRIAGTYALGVARILASETSAAAEVNEARELAEKALAADPSQPEARVALGFLHINNGEHAAAASELVRAVAAAPNSVEALDGIGRFLVEVRREALGVKTLRKALAIDPQLAHARHAIARVHALAGDFAAAHEELGPVPSTAGDFVPYILLKGRIALWQDDRNAADALDAAIAAADASGFLTAFSRLSLTNIARVARYRARDTQLTAAIDQTLPLGGAYSPRRIAYHAQLRTETKLAIGLESEALLDLRVADSNGLIDVSWLDQCALFDNVRQWSDFQIVRDATATRAERVAQILDPVRPL